MDILDIWDHFSSSAKLSQARISDPLTDSLQPLRCLAKRLGSRRLRKDPATGSNFGCRTKGRGWSWHVMVMSRAHIDQQRIHGPTLNSFAWKILCNFGEMSLPLPKHRSWCSVPFSYFSQSTSNCSLQQHHTKGRGPRFEHSDGEGVWSSRETDSENHSFLKH